MRFNRGTVILLVVSLVVIVGVLVLLTNQAAAPGSESLTPTGTTGGPVFPGITEDTVARFEIRDNTTGQRLAMTRSSSGASGDAGQTDADGTEDNADADAPEETSSRFEIATSNFPVDQDAAASNLSSFLSLASNDSFTSSDLEQFGLAQPQYSVFAVNSDEAVYVMHVGSKNPAGTRYYAVAAQIGAADTSPEAQAMRPSLEREEVDTSAGPSVPGLNVDQAVVGLNPTLDAIAEQIQEMEAGPERDQLAATYSAMIEAGALDAFATAEATGEATADADLVSETEMVADLDLPNIETSIEEATPDANAEGTAVVEADLPDEEHAATEEVPSEIQGTMVPITDVPEGTVEPVAINPVQLSGEQTILLVPASTIDTLIALISAPPVIIPTATPTPLPTANPVSEVDQTATAAAQSTTSAMSTQFAALAEATDEATSEATEPAAEATDAP